MIHTIQLALLDNETVTIYREKNGSIYVDSNEAELILDVKENTLPRIDSRFFNKESKVRRYWTPISVIVAHMNNHKLNRYASGNPYRV